MGLLSHIMTLPHEQSDTELVRQARNGDHAAFRVLVERYESLVAATVIGMLGRGDEAQDVGQQTFIRFFRALDKFRGDAAVGTYLTRIAINLALNALKRRKRWRERFFSQEETEWDMPDPDDASTLVLEREERAALVHQAVQRLEPKFRSVVVLRMLNGYSSKETAQILNIPLGTVLSRLSRAQDKLRDFLEPYLDDL